MEAIIQKYAEGGDLLRKAIEGLGPRDLLAFPIPGTWSIQQVVLHLMDSDLIASDRMKRIIAEDNPVLLAYDETRFAKHLAYDQQSVLDAVAIFDLNRRQFTRVLRTLAPATLRRQGRHSETGIVVLDKTLEHYVEHLEHHLGFIKAKRRALGQA